MTTFTTKKQAEDVVREVLSRGAGKDALAWMLAGGALLVIGLLCAVHVVDRFLTYDGYLNDGAQQALLAAVVVTPPALYLVVFKGIRAMGARGTRVGRIALDFPERVFSVQPIVRRVTMGGATVNEVHVLSISVDSGDTLEVNASPMEMPRLLAAFAAWSGPNVVGSPLAM